MKLKKKVKRTILVIIILIVAVVGVLLANKYVFKKENTKELKVVDNISKYGYKLKENKPKAYKDMFNELKEILILC